MASASSCGPWTRADHVLDPKAVDIDQPAAQAHPAVALLAGDQHADQAERGIGVGGIDVGPPGMTLDGEPLAPPGAHPAPGELALRGAGVVLGGDAPDQGGHLCGPQAKGTGNLLGRTARRAQHTHSFQQLLAVHAGIIHGPTGAVKPPTPPRRPEQHGPAMRRSLRLPPAIARPLPVRPRV